MNLLQTTWMERGTVSGRVALLLRSAEVKPLFDRFVQSMIGLSLFLSPFMRLRLGPVQRTCALRGACEMREGVTDLREADTWLQMNTWLKWRLDYTQTLDPNTNKHLTRVKAWLQMNTWLEWRLDYRWTLDSSEGLTTDERLTQVKCRIEDYLTTGLTLRRTLDLSETWLQMKTWLQSKHLTWSSLCSQVFTSQSSQVFALKAWLLQPYWLARFKYRACLSLSTCSSS